MNKKSDTKDKKNQIIDVKVNSKVGETEESKINNTNVKKHNKKIENKNKKNKKKHKVRRTILLIVLFLLLVFGIFFVIRVKENGWGLKGIVATVLGHDKNTLENMSEIKFLIVGKSQNLTDTIMVCSYNPKTQEASIMSIPRDTFTGSNKNKATAWDKINALYQQSPQKLLDEVNELTGLDIKYYVMVDTSGLKDLVDAIGGVEFNVPINMTYDDSSQNLHVNLKAGTQLLNGDKAEQLLRFRHNNNGTTYPSEYGVEDIGRMRTQREFIKTVIQKMLNIGSITKINDYISIAKQYTQTNMDFDDIKDYAPYALEFNLDNLKTGVLPGEAEKCNGVWVYIVNKTEAKEMVQELFLNNSTSTDTASTTTNSTANITSSNTTSTSTTSASKGVNVEILNGTSNTSNLTEVKNTLTKLGYTVSKTGTTSTTAKTTIINRTSQSSDITDEIKNSIGVGTISTGTTKSGVDITIVIGSDY